MHKIVPQLTAYKTNLSTLKKTQLLPYVTGAKGGLFASSFGF